MRIRINSKAIIENIQPHVLADVKKFLTLDNPKYAEAVKMGYATHDIPDKLKFYKETMNGIVAPRGAAQTIYERFCGQMGIDVQDDRLVLPEVDFQFKGELREYQRAAVDKMMKISLGVLSSPTGAGKTIMGLYIISKIKQPALILVHTSLLQKQWIDRVSTFLNIPREEIGVIGGGKFKVGERITVATVQTLVKRGKEIADRFGCVLADECHRVPAMQFAEAVSFFPARYRYGLSATPYRRDKLDKVIRLMLGPVAARVDKSELVSNGNLCEAEVHWIKTDFKSSYNPADYYSKALSELTQDEDRNQLIVRTAVENLNGGLTLILSDRKAHCTELERLLTARGISCQTLTGDTPKRERENMDFDSCRCLIATGQLIGEGFDLPAIENLHLTNKDRSCEERTTILSDC